MDTRPTLLTPRLVLRPFALSDAKRVQELAGRPEVAATTGTVPHPYEDGMAETWISSHVEWHNKGFDVTLAITRDEVLVGCISLGGISAKHRKAELGYWVGVPYWGQGIASEAATELLRYARDELKLNKITARHMSKNPASGRVMQKLGMLREGYLREEFFKDGVFEDVVLYGALLNPAH